MIRKIQLAPRVLIAFFALETIPLLVNLANWLMRTSEALHQAASHNLTGIKTLKNAA